MFSGSIHLQERGNVEHTCDDAHRFRLSQTRKPENSLAKVMTTSNLYTKTPFS
jgi:hypothetical protein